MATISSGLAWVLSLAMIALPPAGVIVGLPYLVPRIRAMVEFVRDITDVFRSFGRMKPNPILLVATFISGCFTIPWIILLLVINEIGVSLEQHVRLGFAPVLGMVIGILFAWRRLEREYPGGKDATESRRT